MMDMVVMVALGCGCGVTGLCWQQESVARVIVVDLLVVVLVVVVVTVFKDIINQISTAEEGHL